MEQRAKVRCLYADGTAQVAVIRESACSGDCHKCGGCGAQQETLLFTAENPIGARPGELVTVSGESAPVLKAVVVLYMVPVGLFFLGYALGELLWKQGILFSGLAFLGGIALAAVYDRKRAAKQKTVYTITGYPAGAQRIGDNDLD